MSMDDDYQGHLGIPDGYDIFADSLDEQDEQDTCERDDSCDPYDPDFGGGFT